MTARRTRSLTLIVAASFVVAMFVPAETADAQRIRRRRTAAAAQSGGNRDAAATPSSGAGETSFSSLSGKGKIEKWATDQLKRHDKNGDKMLQPDEQNELGDSKRADLNADGIITKDELVSFSLGETTSASTSSTGDKPAAGPKSTSTTSSGTTASAALSQSKRTITGGSDKRKSYRFTPPAERLPSSGLPGWFKSRDADGDGQVAMHEYSRSWNDRTAKEFTDRDKNNDGVITADEAKR